MTGIRAAVDTNIVIAFLNGDNEVLKKFETCDQILLPFPVKGELLFGAMCSTRKKENVTRLRKLFPMFETIDSSSDIEYRYAKIKSDLKGKGRPIPENDIWIAACAQSAEVTLSSRDGHFKEIDNLSTVEW
jgi:tRNA(fMet)-specific endonuclease VapC